MATVKKATTLEVTKPQPKRFEIGYRFGVMAEIVDISDDGGQIYYGIDVDIPLNNDDYITADKLLEYEFECNPKAKKDYITDKLKVAKANVAALEKELAAIK